MHKHNKLEITILKEKDMLKLCTLLPIIFFLSCSNSDYQKRTKATTQQSECEEKISYGKTTICLPEIDGMTECYFVPKVKEMFDLFNYPGNSMLAVFLNNNTFTQVDKLDEIEFDDYFTIYVTNEFADAKFDETILDELKKLMENNYLKKSWAEINQKMSKKIDFLNFDKPILLESYALHNYARTFILLMKYRFNNQEKIIWGTVNCLLIKEKIIFLAYYLDYNGMESIKPLKTKNDYIVLKLLDENN